eukprot:TRINITY_DN10555_c0_g1_i1.p1 TRINITY_DN10555_c0_g1~~TRINITY_DN10555_c0_g1_i1.p1  ORF type:complete len:515 (-),score=118.65 TRINITY_DN10555_c0_g1_i1:95-1639(-)
MRILQLISSLLLLLTTISLAQQQPQQTCSPADTLTFTSTDHVHVNGARMDIKGIAWYGFEGGSFCVEGLDQRPLGDILDLVKANDFNVIRIPFAADIVVSMNARYPSNINFGINPGLQGKTSIQVLDEIFTQAAARGLLIMLDMHLFDWSQYNNQPGLWYSHKCKWEEGFCVETESDCVRNRDGICYYYTEQANKDMWSTLVERYKSRWNFLAADLQNELHEPATWGSGDASTDYAAAAERISDEIFARNADFRGLIFVEGIGNVPIEPFCENHTATNQGGGHWWGGNFEAVRCRQLNLANGRNDRLVYSPHVYGPSVWDQDYFTWPSYPQNMPAIWDAHFGSVRQLSGKSVVVGEWGGPNTGRTGIWLNAFADYLIAKDMRDNFHWSLNPNRISDTPGILVDWYTPDQDRMTLLKRVQPNPTKFTVSGSNVCYTSSSLSSPVVVVATSASASVSATTTSIASSTSTSTSAIGSTTSVASTSARSTSTTTTGSAAATTSATATATLVTTSPSSN